MNIKTAQALRANDWVVWSDPDEELCSKVLQIARVRGGLEWATIESPDGAVLVCPWRELERVKIHHEYPPIPWRHFDWCAYVDDGSEQPDHGYGATPEAAIESLRESLEL